MGTQSSNLTCPRRPTSPKSPSPTLDKNVFRGPSANPAIIFHVETAVERSCTLQLVGPRGNATFEGQESSCPLQGHRLSSREDCEFHKRTISFYQLVFFPEHSKRGFTSVSDKIKRTTSGLTSRVPRCPVKRVTRRIR